jgi:cell division protein ZipA
METELRWILIGVGIVLVVGILWDVFRGRREQTRVKQYEMPEESFDDVILIQPKTARTFISISVMARYPENFLGPKTLKVFEELHLYADSKKKIFHRYENVDGTGDVLFSIVSAVEPGILDQSHMSTFVTPGLTLFFTNTELNRSIAAWEVMLRTARQMALLLDGELRDDRRCIVTPRRIEQYRDQICAKRG